jgi:PEP-CTERM motif-containing protein
MLDSKDDSSCDTAAPSYSARDFPSPAPNYVDRVNFEGGASMTYMARWISLVLTVGLAIVGQPAVSHAVNLIQNGDFEIVAPSNATGGFWTTFNIDGAGGWQATGGNPGGNFILSAAGQAATDPTAEQSVSGLTVGALYAIGVDVACGHPGFCPGTGNSFGILLDNNMATPIFEAPTPPTGEFVHFGTLFTATNTMHVIGIAGERNQTDADPRIDNVTLECVRNCPAETVPEPTTLLLLGSGVAALAYVGRRRSE